MGTLLAPLGDEFLVLLFDHGLGVSQGDTACLVAASLFDVERVEELLVDILHSMVIFLHLQKVFLDRGQLLFNLSHVLLVFICGLDLVLYLLKVAETSRVGSSSTTCGRWWALLLRSLRRGELQDVLLVLLVKLLIALVVSQQVLEISLLTGLILYGSKHLLGASGLGWL